MKKDKYRNRLGSVLLLNEFIFRYYQRLGQKRENGSLVASVSLGFPVDILCAFDIVPMYPQNHAAMYATLGQAGKILDMVEEKGYLPDICSEVKISLGTLLHDCQLSFRMPKPDCVLAATNVCRSMVKFAETISRELNIPFHLHDMPFQIEYSHAKHAVEYVVAQFGDLIQFLVKLTGKKLNIQKLTRCLRLSAEASAAWHDILSFGATVPAPFDAMDIYRHMFPLITSRGSARTVEYYKMLRYEVIHRVEKGIGAVNDEQYRLMWDYLPVYHKMNFFSRILSKRKAAVVSSTFFYPVSGGRCRASVIEDALFRPKAQRLVKGLASNHLALYPNISLQQKASMIKQLAERYHVHGIIIHCDRSCKPQSLPQYEIKNILERDLKMPCLLIDADSVDPRFFSEEQIVTRIEAFLERLSRNS